MIFSEKSWSFAVKYLGAVIRSRRFSKGKKTNNAKGPKNFQYSIKELTARRFIGLDKQVEV